MPSLPFGKELAREYERLYEGAAIRPERLAQVRADAERLCGKDCWAKYQRVCSLTGVPAHVVAILHSLECGWSFAGHLHNGDPLSARTVHVPRGRPKTGEPPFAWEESAADALRIQDLDRWTDWSVAGTAYVLERYNGFGYRNRRPPVPSPYLWSCTTAYTAGKFVADGVWSDTAVSRQSGGMALLRALIASGRVVLPEPAKRHPAAGDGAARV